MRLSDEVVAIAVEGGAHGAGFGAGRQLALALPLKAHVALAHARQPFGPFIRWHLEGAGLHAVAAAHTLFSVISNRAERRLLQGSHGAHRDAGRLQAVHAQTPRIFVAMSLDGGQLMSRNPFLTSDLVVVR